MTRRSYSFRSNERICESNVKFLPFLRVLADVTSATHELSLATFILALLWTQLQREHNDAYMPIAVVIQPNTRVDYRRSDSPAREKGSERVIAKATKAIRKPWSRAYCYYDFLCRGRHKKKTITSAKSRVNVRFVGRTPRTS